jgi:hypothetical protein
MMGDELHTLVFVLLPINRLSLSKMGDCASTLGLLFARSIPPEQRIALHEKQLSLAATEHKSQQEILQMSIEDMKRLELALVDIRREANGCPNDLHTHLARKVMLQKKHAERQYIKDLELMMYWEKIYKNEKFSCHSQRQIETIAQLTAIGLQLSKGKFSVKSVEKAVERYAKYREASEATTDALADTYAEQDNEDVSVTDDEIKNMFAQDKQTNLDTKFALPEVLDSTAMRVKKDIPISRFDAEADAIAFRAHNRFPQPLPPLYRFGKPENKVRLLDDVHDSQDDNQSDDNTGATDGSGEALLTVDEKHAKQKRKSIGLSGVRSTTDVRVVMT